MGIYFNPDNGSFVSDKNSKIISYMLMKIYHLTKIPFVIIIDEWDCVIRNSGDQALVHNYLQFLHLLF